MSERATSGSGDSSEGDSAGEGAALAKLLEAQSRKIRRMERDKKALASKASAAEAEAQALREEQAAARRALEGAAEVLGDLIASNLRGDERARLAMRGAQGDEVGIMLGSGGSSSSGSGGSSASSSDDSTSQSESEEASSTSSDSGSLST
jgi:hypothetical protein